MLRIIAHNPARRNPQMLHFLCLHMLFPIGFCLLAPLFCSGRISQMKANAADALCCQSRRLRIKKRRVMQRCKPRIEPHKRLLQALRSLWVAHHAAEDHPALRIEIRQLRKF